MISEMLDHELIKVASTPRDVRWCISMPTIYVNKTLSLFNFFPDPILKSTQMKLQTESGDSNVRILDF